MLMSFDADPSPWLLLLIPAAVRPAHVAVHATASPGSDKQGIAVPGSLDAVGT